MQLSKRTLICRTCSFTILAMHSLAAAIGSTVRNGADMGCVRYFLLCVRWGIRRFAKVNVNKVNIVLLYRINYSCKLFLSCTLIILTIIGPTVVCKT